MPVKGYFVSYDLKAPGKNYKKLKAYLESLRAVEIMDSLYYFKSEETAEQLRDEFRKHVDENDYLIVIVSAGGSRNTKVKNSVNSWK